MPDWSPDNDYDEFTPDPEGPQDRDLPADDDDETITERCPRCGREVVEGTDWCPHCEQWIERSRTNSRSVGVKIVAVALLALFLLWLLW
ncbi:MAG: hypothetical protein JXO22_17380 [Phycisphaerae bacterium]|nr:hypothetical protein [Phycisphaerae bacterium]